MELRHLRYFVVVAEEQSFTKAANRLYVAQPALSRQIQNLEDELGVQLFERGSRPVKMTEGGEFFYQHARKILTNAEQVVAMTKRIAIFSDQINIGFVGSLLYGLLPKIINSFRKQHSGMKMNLIELSTVEQIQALKEGKIDIGFGRLGISDPDVKRYLLREERLMLVVTSDHKLAQSDDGIHLAEISDEPILLYPNTPKPNFSSQILSLFSECMVAPTNIVEVREIQLALGLVSAGEGISIIPESAQTIRFPNLKFIPILDHVAKTPIFMAVRNLDESQLIESMKRCIHQIYLDENIEFNLDFGENFS